MHGYANPARFLRLARWLTPLLLVTGLIVTGVALGWGLFFGPAERLQGETARIVYLHVPTAWLGMGGWRDGVGLWSCGADLWCGTGFGLGGGEDAVL